MLRYFRPALMRDTLTMYNTLHVPFRYSGLPVARRAVCSKRRATKFEDTKTVSWLADNMHFMTHRRGFGGFPTHPGKFVPIITRPQFYTPHSRYTRHLRKINNRINFSALCRRDPFASTIQTFSLKVGGNY